MAAVQIPFVRDLAFEYGRCDSVSPLIRRVVAKNPGPFTYLGTATFIVGKGEVAVIDPGPDLPEHLEALIAALEGETVTHILVTHHHSDHSPLARPLQEKTGAKIYGCAVGGQDVGQCMLPKQTHISDVHRDAEQKSCAHADTARLANAPEDENQRNPVGDPGPGRSRQEIEDQRDEQAEHNEPRADRQQDA